MFTNTEKKCLPGMLITLKKIFNLDTNHEKLEQKK